MSDNEGLDFPTGRPPRDVPGSAAYRSIGRSLVAIVRANTGMSTEDAMKFLDEQLTAEERRLGLRS